MWRGTGGELAGTSGVLVGYWRGTGGVLAKSGILGVLSGYWWGTEYSAILVLLYGQAMGARGVLWGYPRGFFGGARKALERY